MYQRRLIVMYQNRAFTLLELLVAIGLISLLSVVFLLAIGSVRKATRQAQTVAELNAIEQGIRTYREVTGADYPDSRGDREDYPDYVYSPYSWGNDTLSVEETVLPLHIEGGIGGGQLTPSIPNDKHDPPFEVNPGLDDSVGAGDSPEDIQGGQGSGPWGYGGESGGGEFDPSDSIDGPGDPPNEGPTWRLPKQKVAGANLLVWALVGADLLGTPGCRDLNRDGVWWNDTHLYYGGLYALDTDYGHSPKSEPETGLLLPERVRYGPFINKKEIRIVNMLEYLSEFPDQDKDFYFTLAQLHLLDGFGHPILYYKARPNKPFMIGTADQPGIYDQRDNAQYTGTGLGGEPGLNLGAGPHHFLNPVSEPIHPDPSRTNLEDPRFDGTLARFIWNRQITVRNEPVNKDSYILISAGADALYGTDDDITNFDR